MSSLPLFHHQPQILFDSLISLKFDIYTRVTHIFLSLFRSLDIVFPRISDGLSLNLRADAK